MSGVNSKNDRKKARNIGLAVVALIAAIVYWRWVFRLGILTAGDWSFMFTESQRALFDLPRVWDPSGFGAINVNAAGTVINVGWGVLGNIASNAISERVL